MKIKFSLITLCLFLISCSTSKITYNDSYDDLQINKSRLNIVIDYIDLRVSNDDDVLDDFGEGNVEQTYIDFFNEELVENMKRKSKFTQITLIEEYDRSILESQSLKLNQKESLTINLPSSDTSNGINAGTFTLFIEKINTDSGWESMAMGGKSKTLYHSMNFALWDDSASQTISYGKILVKNSAVLGMVVDESTWKDAISDVSELILENSPFKKKHIVYSR